ncbi:MAG: hypothetical protein ACO1NZ_14495 [Adhaeribacter sp.]
MMNLARLSLLLLLFLSFACSDKEEAQPEFRWTRDAQVSDLSGRWVLVRTIGGRVMTEVKDSQRSFEFGADSTFSFTDFDGAQVNGTFALKKGPEGHEYLLLTYQTGATLSSWNHADALYPGNNSMLMEDHSPLDGPIYFYQQVSTGATK